MSHVIWGWEVLGSIITCAYTFVVHSNEKKLFTKFSEILVPHVFVDWKFWKINKFNKFNKYRECVNINISTSILMVYRKISPDMKQRALQLIDKGWEMDDVAEVLRIASKSIRRWANNYDIHGCVDPPSVLQGCWCILNAEAISGLLQLTHPVPAGNWRMVGTLSWPTNLMSFQKKRLKWQLYCCLGPFFGWGCCHWC